MRKETTKTVEKVWGNELWLVNSDKYCGKLLTIDMGAESSYHYHKEKEETFYCLWGQVGLIVEGKSYMLNPFSRPKTIMAGERHSFSGLAESTTLLEVSTHHDDNDVYRLGVSKDGVG